MRVLFSFTLCVSVQQLLFPSPAEGIDETMASCLKESHVSKLEMTECVHLSPVCVAAICGGLLRNATLEQLVVKSCSTVSHVFHLIPVYRIVRNFRGRIFS